MPKAGNDGMKEVLYWLAGQFAGRLAVAYQSLTGVQAKIDAREAPSAAPRADDIIWLEPVSVSPGSCMWVCVPQSVWNRVGRQILESAGVDDVSDEDARSAFHELLQQSTAPLGNLMTTKLQREITVGPGIEQAEPPADAAWFAVPLSPAGENWQPILFTVSPELVQALIPTHVPPKQGNEQRAVLAPADAPAASDAREGRNLDLLMEVELPVSVSFGRTRMRLKDAIKLTTGSIVELNRSVSEPVEVIVNNCVIARGEVVVVEGNYGIRIRQVVSREERLRTLF